MPTDPPPGLFAQIAHAQATLDAGFAHLPPAPDAQVHSALTPEAVAVLHRAAHRLHDNYPYAHPLYAGQMLKPPHPIARAAYTLAMSLNPNNHALDGGRASSSMELEAVAALARMFGWPHHLGHLTSGGTFANLEALWIAGQLARETPRQSAGQLAPANTIAASTEAHYTHSRISAVLGLPFVPIPADTHGRMDLHALEHALNHPPNGIPISTVVATLGTTAIGAVDPLDQILTLRARYPFRLHVDAAYGGYFTLARNLAPAARAAFDTIPHADSLVIDPHKHGLQPYGCGCILFADPAVGRIYKHNSPYTYFSSKDLHLGEVSLECSRAGASAVALWATQQLLPYTPADDFAQSLESCRTAALNLHSRIAVHPGFLTPIAPPELDILFWAVRAETPGQSSLLARLIFEECARRDLHLALAKLPATFFPAHSWPDPNAPAAHITCLRSVLMKPEHLAWEPEIWSRLQAATAAVLRT